MSTLNLTSTSSTSSELAAGTGNSQRHVAENLREEATHSLVGVSRGQFEPDDKLEPIAIVGIALEFPQDATSPRISRTRG